MSETLLLLGTHTLALAIGFVLAYMAFKIYRSASKTALQTMSEMLIVKHNKAYQAPQQQYIDTTPQVPMYNEVYPANTDELEAEIERMKEATS